MVLREDLLGLFLLVWVMLRGWFGIQKKQLGCWLWGSCLGVGFSGHTVGA